MRDGTKLLGGPADGYVVHDADPRREYRYAVRWRGDVYSYSWLDDETMSYDGGYEPNVEQAVEKFEEQFRAFVGGAR
jgi:hypothetical protein